MTDKAVEMMKKIIEEKKMKSSGIGMNRRAEKSIGKVAKGKTKNKKTGACIIRIS